MFMMKNSLPCWLALAAALAMFAGCGKDAAPGYQGYIEGEYLYLAAPQSGYLKSLDAPRGSHVDTGQLIFAIATDPDAQALAEAEARTGSAREKVENLREPHRQPEIAALEANLNAAQAALRLTRKRLQQQQALARNQIV